MVYDYCKNNGDPRKQIFLHFFEQDGKIYTTESILSRKNKRTRITNSILHRKRVGLYRIKEAKRHLFRAIDALIGKKPLNT